ncbi:hypothetical protein [Enterococcus sp. DIV0098]|uniref:hypothetical protein n=1 Tax=Enterococcus sp. DIV0098 TaxID=2774843 RepID=UPI003F28B52B
MINAILVMAILGISFWNIRQQQENVSLRKLIAVQEEKRIAYEKEEKKLRKENENLSEEVVVYSESLKKVQKVEENTRVDSDLNTEFINVVTKLFEANLNFTPENYADKKKEVAFYLTEELNKEYFGQKRNTYQDANGTSSQLELLEVYLKAIQDSKTEGLAVAYYKSKNNNQYWNRRMNIFKISYNSEVNKITNIINLGNGFSE